MIFNKLYDLIALRDNRYIELDVFTREDKNAGEAQTREVRNREKSRKYTFAYLATFASVATIALVAIAVTLALPLLPAIIVGAGLLVDAVVQAMFCTWGSKRLLNRKLFPLITSTLLMVAAWLESSVLSIVSAPYYLLKDLYAKNKHFDDIINRRAAYGRFTGTMLVVGVTLLVTLLANPFTGLPLLGLIAAISTTVAVGFLVIKACEFIGRLSGALKTKALAIDVLANPPAADAVFGLRATIDNREGFRSTSKIMAKVFNDMFEPSNVRNRKAGATILENSSGSNFAVSPRSQRYSAIPDKLTELDKQSKVSLETDSASSKENFVECYAPKAGLV